MAKDIPSKKYPGVYYRELKNGDRSFFIIYRIDGKQKRLSIGKKSEGITAAFAHQQRVQILNSEKFGGETAELLQRKQKNDPTFLELFDYYLTHGPGKDSTKRIMRYLRNQVPFGDKRKVTPEDIVNFQREIMKTLAPNTVDSKINLLSAVFKFAIDVGKYRHENPCRNIKRNNINDERLRYLSKDEIKQLLSAVSDSPQLYLFTKLALCTGARLSTLVRIRSEHVKGDTVRLYNIKTGQFYTGFLDAETKELLQGKEGYVLTIDNTGLPPTEHQYQWRMKRILDRLFNQGVTDSRDRVVVHTLRHTVASLMVQNGNPLQVVAKVLNHQSIRSTERYAKLHQDNIKSELHRLWD